MNKKCPNCQLVNFAGVSDCVRCQTALVENWNKTESANVKPKILRRVVVCVAVLIFVFAGFYASLVFSAKSLAYDERKSIEAAIDTLEQKGFADEVFLLRHLTVYRANDNWLNASVEKENAYAATNFPFEIMTVYPDFFAYSTDDTERAAILLHEAQHLKGADEKKAYEFVWKNREKLGWTRANYAESTIWQNVRKQTKEYSPNLFICQINNFGDCTEN